MNNSNKTEWKLSNIHSKTTGGYQRGQAYLQKVDLHYECEYNHFEQIIRGNPDRIAPVIEYKEDNRSYGKQEDMQTVDNDTLKKNGFNHKMNTNLYIHIITGDGFKHGFQCDWKLHYNGMRLVRDNTNTIYMQVQYPDDWHRCAPNWSLTVYYWRVLDFFDIADRLYKNNKKAWRNFESSVGGQRMYQIKDYYENLYNERGGLRKNQTQQSQHRQQHQTQTPQSHHKQHHKIKAQQQHHKQHHKIKSQQQHHKQQQKKWSVRSKNKN